MARAYGQPPSTWLLTPADRSSPEGQTVAYDLDLAIFTLGRTHDAEMQEMARREEQHKRRVGSLTG